MSDYNYVSKNVENARIQMESALKNANIDYEIECMKIQGGYKITFPSLPGDIVCHNYSYGGDDGLWESYNFPWDDDDVTGWMTAEEFISRYNEAYR